MQGALLRNRTNEVLCHLIFRESARPPVVIVIENVHWIDASSEDFLKSLAQRVREHRILLVLTTRPGPPKEWLARRDDGDDRAGGARSGRPPRDGPRALRRARRSRSRSSSSSLAKGEGNPLYVEEIVRQLQETEGILVEDGEARLRAADVTVPETIHDIIAARVDRLDESPKRTLQVASVVGRRFGVSLVSRVRESDRRSGGRRPGGASTPSISSSRARTTPS